MRRVSRLSVLLPALSLAAVVVGFAQTTSAQTTTNTTPALSGDPLALKAAAPNSKYGEALSKTCQGCHGSLGHSSESQYPSLGGQIPNYTTLQLAAFRAKLRPSTVMQQMAAKLSDQDIVDLAAYYAGQQPRKAWEANAALKAKGEQIYNVGVVARNVTACVVCHGASGRGNNDLHIASITHQSPKYTLEVLHEFKNVPDYKIPYPNAMHIVTAQMTEAELSEVTAYLSSMAAK